jgi:hypothetical protein
MTAAKWEHLQCEFPDKPHNWKRELGQRGRKPRFCPKHRPEPKLSSATTDLYCEIGKHNWIRPPTRGRVPASCPDHRETKVIQAAPRNENGKVTLHCANGGHDWERSPQRGRKPTSCPMHPNTPVGVRTVSVNVIPGSGEGAGIPEPKRRGRPKKYETKEEQTEAQLAASRERVDLLEGKLKERGTHLSQQAPYILYKKVGEKPGRKGTEPTTTWEKVEEHSPLMQAQYINKHEADFVAGNYRYERNGRVVVL